MKGSAGGMILCDPKKLKLRRKTSPVSSTRLLDPDESYGTFAYTNQANPELVKK